jgi:hypothetical protein
MHAARAGRGVIAVVSEIDGPYPAIAEQSSRWTVALRIAASADAQ